MVLQQLLPTVREPSEALAGGGHFHDSGIPEVSDVSTYLLAGCVARSTLREDWRTSHP